MVCIFSLSILSLNKENAFVRLHTGTHTHTSTHTLKSLTLTWKTLPCKNKSKSELLNWKEDISERCCVRIEVKMEDSKSAPRRGAALLPLMSHFSSSSVVQADSKNLQHKILIYCRKTMKKQHVWEGLWHGPIASAGCFKQAAWTRRRAQPQRPRP